MLRGVLAEFGNHPSEVHAVFNGLYTGLLYPLYYGLHEQAPDDDTPEPHYWRLGFLLAVMLKAILGVWLIGRAF